MMLLVTIAKERRLITALLVMMLSAGLFSWLACFGFGVRLNELPSILDLAGHSHNVPLPLARGGHLSGYAAVVAGWNSVFGGSPAALRSLSLVCYLMTIPAMYWAAVTAYGKETGMVAALMTTVSPIMQWQGSEATVYGLLAFWAAINVCCFVRILGAGLNERRAWVGYGITVALGLWTHPVFALPLIFQLLTVGLHRRQELPVLRGRTVVLGAIVSGAVAFWVCANMVEVASLDRWINPLDWESGADRLSNALVAMVFGFQGSAVSALIAATLPLAVLVVFCALSLTSRPSRVTLFLATAVGGTLALLAIVNLLMGPLPLSRYAGIVVPTLYVLIARGVCSLPEPFRLLSKTGLLMAMAWALARQTFDPDLAMKQDYRGVSQYLASSVGSNDVVMVSSPIVAFPMEYYTERSVPINTVPAWDRSAARPTRVYDEAALEDQVARLLRGRDKCWLVLGCDQGEERLVENFFNGHLRRLEYREFTGGLKLAAFREGRPLRTVTSWNTQKSGLNLLNGVRLYVNSDSPAKRQARAWGQVRPHDAALMDKIASQPVAFWLTRNNRSVAPDIRKIMNAAEQEKAVPCFVTYYFPERDKGGFSTGGAQDAKEYLGWIQTIADTIGDQRAILILEPDTLGFMMSVPERERERRLMLLRKAVHIFSQKKGVISYVDAGHCNWVDPSEMAKLLRRVGIGSARGFALNVSNFYPSSEVIAYGSKISKLLDGKPFVIDISRNGLGATNDVFNPPGRALGLPPTVHTGHPLVDAFLWIKNPGESDGAANGGPAAGEWWAEYALGLAERAEW